jgi:hypothetical protein
LRFLCFKNFYDEKINRKESKESAKKKCKERKGKEFDKFVESGLKTPDSRLILFLFGDKKLWIFSLE